MAQLIYKKYKPEKNPFYTLVADVTHRCNMVCSNCYIPNRNIEDMSADKLVNFLTKLKKRTEIRLIGAEPTMRKDLPDIIYKIRKLGHRPVLMTNGLKLSDLSYVKTLKNFGLRTVYISMNGVDLDEWYQKIDKMKCAKKKLKALENIYSEKFFISIGCILIRDLNSQAPSRFLKLLETLKISALTLRFRNIGQLGRYDKNVDNFSFQELIDLCSKQFNVSKYFIQKQNKINGYFEKNTRFFKLPPPPPPP